EVVWSDGGLPGVATTAGGVEAEDPRELRHGDVVDDAVVGALQERLVDRDHGPDALRGQTRRERGRVRLGDADVEEAVGPLPLEDPGAGARWHGCRDRDELGVFACALGERLAGHRGPWL